MTEISSIRQTSDLGRSGFQAVTTRGGAVELDSTGGRPKTVPKVKGQGIVLPLASERTLKEIEIVYCFPNKDRPVELVQGRCRKLTLDVSVVGKFFLIQDRMRDELNVE